MEETIAIDKQGRLVVPSYLREALGVKDGGQISIRLDGPRLVLEPASKDVKDQVNRWAKLARDTKAEACVEDAETPSQALTISISYRQQSGSWIGPITASWEPNYGGYKYYDLTIPGDATAGLYDVKVEVSDGNGGSAVGTETGEFTVVKVNTNPVINYIHVWGYPGGLLDPAGTIKTGESIRIFTSVADAETPSSCLTVNISYRPQSGSWTGPIQAQWEPNYGGYKYYDWVIPGGVTAGLYDVKVEAEDLDGGVATPLVELSKFYVSIRGTFDVKRQAQVYVESKFSEIADYDYGVTCALSGTQITELKVYSPTTKLFAYVNFESVYDYSVYYAGFVEAGWILYDDTSPVPLEVRSVDFATEVLVDMGNPGYQDWLVDRLETILADKNYYGIMADNFPRPCVPGVYRVGDTTIINPRTGAEWTNAEWVDAELALLAKIHAAGIKVVGNGIPQAHDNIGYYSNLVQSDRILTSDLDGFVIEGPTAWTLADFNSRSANQFKQNLDFINLVCSKGKFVFFSNTGTIGLETTDIATFSFAQYCLAGFGSKYSFKFREMAYMASSGFHAIVDIDLGLPVENDYVLNSNGLYSRRFRNYIVVCNPTAGALTYTCSDPVISQFVGARGSAFIAVS